jgi:hypothetical protein
MISYNSIVNKGVNCKVGRQLKNIAEQKCAEALTARGWEVTKRGWPDFICYRGNELILVEVKPKQDRRLSKKQQRLMTALVNLGIKCFKWTPDGGLEPVKKESNKERNNR